MNANTTTRSVTRAAAYLLPVSIRHIGSVTSSVRQLLWQILEAPRETWSPAKPAACILKYFQYNKFEKGLLLRRIRRELSWNFEAFIWNIWIFSKWHYQSDILFSSTTLYYKLSGVVCCAIDSHQKENVRRVTCKCVRNITKRNYNLLGWQFHAVNNMQSSLQVTLNNIVFLIF